VLRVPPRRALRGAELAETATAGEADPEGAVGLCDELMHAAIVRQASDIHIDPGEKQVQIRLRVDGVLERFRTLPTSAHNASSALQGPRRDGHRGEAGAAGRHFTHRFGPTGQTLDVRLATLADQVR